MSQPDLFGGPPASAASGPPRGRAGRGAEAMAPVSAEAAEAGFRAEPLTARLRPRTLDEYAG
ncbi:MAG: replication-associated recombination protein A, partial [Verrucomicrobiota bacterium]